MFVIVVELHAIMIASGRDNIKQLENISIDDIEYHPVSDDDKWKIPIIKEIIDVKHGRMNVDGFSFEELDEICGHLCVA